MAKVSKTPKQLEVAAALAWDAIRGANNAKFASITPDFKSALMYHAQGVNKTFTAAGGTTYWARFEQELLRQIIGG